MPRDPSLPLGYKEIVRDDFLYYLHSGAKRKDIKGLHKFLKDEQKKFSKVYGKFTISPDDPPIIVLHATKEDATDLSERAAEYPSGFFFDFTKRRIFAVPLTRSAEAQAYLGSALHSLFFIIRFGEAAPYWLYEGEVRATWVEYMAGRKLPALSDGYAKSIPEKILALDQVPALRGKDAAGLTNQAFCYVVFFRVGPKKYRKPFNAFLKAYAKTGDWQQAQKDHLFSLDQKKLQKDMAKFAKEELK